MHTVFLLTLRPYLLCNLHDKIFLSTSQQQSEQGTRATQKAKSGGALYTLHGTYIHIFYSCRLAINISACHERTTAEKKQKRDKRNIKKKP